MITRLTAVSYRAS